MFRDLNAEEIERMRQVRQEAERMRFVRYWRCVNAPCVIAFPANLEKVLCPQHGNFMVLAFPNIADELVKVHKEPTTSAQRWWRRRVPASGASDE